MDKIYVGNGKELFNGDVVSFALNLTKLGEAKEHFFEFSGSKYVKLKVVKKKGGADQYGKTHYIEVDTFDPTKQPKQAQQPQDEDIPF
jgi:hypothetical protein